jgi:hypothetical protein
MEKRSQSRIGKGISYVAGLATYVSTLLNPLPVSAEEIELRAITRGGWQGNTENPAGAFVEYHNAFGDNNQSAPYVEAEAGLLGGFEGTVGAGFRQVNGDYKLGVNVFGDFYSPDTENLDGSVEQQVSVGGELFTPLVDLHANAYFGSEHTGMDGTVVWTPYQTDNKRLDLVGGVYNFEHKDECREDIKGFSFGPDFKFPLWDGWQGVATLRYFSDENANQRSNFGGSLDAGFGTEQDVKFDPVRRTRVSRLRFDPIECAGEAQAETQYVTNTVTETVEVPVTTTETITVTEYIEVPVEPTSEPGPFIPEPVEPVTPEEPGPEIPEEIPGEECDGPVIPNITKLNTLDDKLSFC